MAKEKKNPWIAALLNFLLWGLGYLYVGKKKNFGVLLIIGVILALVLTRNTAWSLRDALFLPGSIIISFAFAYDAYKTAEEVNKGK